MLLLLLYLMTLGVEGSEVVPRMVTESGIDFQVYMLEERGDTAKIDGGEYDDQNNFCFSGSAPEILKFWASASFKLDLFSDDYEVKKTDRLQFRDIYSGHYSPLGGGGLLTKMLKQ